MRQEFVSVMTHLCNVTAEPPTLIHLISSFHPNTLTTGKLFASSHAHCSSLKLNKSSIFIDFTESIIFQIGTEIFTGLRLEAQTIWTSINGIIFRGDIVEILKDELSFANTCLKGIGYEIH